MLDDLSLIEMGFTPRQIVVDFTPEDRAMMHMKLHARAHVEEQRHKEAEQERERNQRQGRSGRSQRRPVRRAHR